MALPGLRRPGDTDLWAIPVLRQVARLRAEEESMDTHSETRPIAGVGACGRSLRPARRQPL